jgi:hypothetical protein
MAEQAERERPQSYFWIDIFVINQNQDVATVSNPSWLQIFRSKIPSSLMVVFVLLW